MPISNFVLQPLDLLLVVLDLRVMGCTTLTLQNSALKSQAFSRFNTPAASDCLMSSAIDSCFWQVTNSKSVEWGRRDPHSAKERKVVPQFTRYCTVEGKLVELDENFCVTFGP